MRRLLAVLCFLPLPALAQSAPPEAPRIDPLLIDPLTGKARPYFDPISADELTIRMRSCIRRDLDVAGEAGAVARSCEAEALDFCARVKARYLFSEPGDCPLSVQLVWGELRHEAGLAVVDALYAKAFAGDEAARTAAEAFTEEDGAWRGRVADACLGDKEASARIACETDLQRERGVAYYARLMELTGSP